MAMRQIDTHGQKGQNDPMVSASTSLAFPSLGDDLLRRSLARVAESDENVLEDVFATLHSLAKVAVTVTFSREVTPSEEWQKRRREMRTMLGVVNRTILLIEAHRDTHKRLVLMDAPERAGEMADAIDAARGRLVQIATVLSFFTRTSDPDLPAAGHLIAPPGVDILGREWDIGTVFDWMVLSPDHEPSPPSHPEPRRDSGATNPMGNLDTDFDLDSLALTDEKLDADWEAAARYMADRGQDVQDMLEKAGAILHAWRERRKMLDDIKARPAQLLRQVV
jgi:hypothetical protein